jgi:hypothetical protein
MTTAKVTGPTACPSCGRERYWGLTAGPKAETNAYHTGTGRRTCG